MRRNPARTWLAVALFGALASSTHCASSVTDNPPLDLVIGIGAECASELHSVELTVSTAGRVDLQKRYAIDPSVALPLVERLTFDPEPGAVHLATAVFDVVEKGKAIDQQFSVSFSDGTTGTVVLSLPCVCIGHKCGTGDQCVEDPPYSGEVACAPVCGDGICVVGEDPTSCPADCSSCGSGNCNGTSSSGAGGASSTSAGNTSTSATTTSTSTMTSTSSGVTCGGLCAPPVPSGWAGPFGVDDSGSCSAEPAWTQTAEGAHSFDASSVSCTACDCNPAPTTCAKSATAYYFTNCTMAVVSGSINNFNCKPDQMIPGAATFGYQVFVDPPALSGCNATGGSKSGSPNAQMSSAICQAPSASGACSNGGSCVEMPTGGLQPNKVCVTQDGDVPCPAGYPNHDVLYQSYTDNLTCSACSCGSPSGGQCDVTVQTFADFGCTQLVNQAGSDMCETASYPGAATVFTNITPGTCSPSSSSISGTVDGASPLTVCCD